MGLRSHDGNVALSCLASPTCIGVQGHGPVHWLSSDWRGKKGKAAKLHNRTGHLWTCQERAQCVESPDAGWVFFFFFSFLFPNISAAKTWVIEVFCLQVIWFASSSGAAESGKSTLVKQIKIIHGYGYSKQELMSFKVKYRYSMMQFAVTYHLFFSICLHTLYYGFF